MYAIIDVETTGGKADYERITEIAIVLHDGERVVDTFSTLLNPEKSIPWNITQLTGITNEMVADAPKFYEVAKKIVQMTEGAIFVAHNVTFDYSFVKGEFARLGYDYSRRQLCTVRMSRKAFPGLRSYSLSNLKKHFEIHADKSHRALDDTLATVAVFERILAAQEGSSIRSFVNHGIKESKLPANITLERLHQMPETCGVYYLHDEQGEVIYVGKSINIRKRLLEHFADMTPKGEKLRIGVSEMSFEVTGSELLALLVESTEIKRLQPRINRAQRIRNFSGAIFTYKDQNGYKCLAFGKRTAKTNLDLVADYPKLDSAKAHLDSMQRRYELCGKLCNLDFHEKACFHYSIKKCRGACVGEESPELYNERVEEALAALHKRLTGNFFIVEKGRTPTEQVIIAVLDGVYYGYTFLDAAETIQHPDDLLSGLVRTPFDPEAARIIRAYIDSDVKKVRVVRF